MFLWNVGIYLSQCSVTTQRPKAKTFISGQFYEHVKHVDHTTDILVCHAKRQAFVT